MAKVRTVANTTVVTIDPTSMDISGFEVGDKVLVIAEKGQLTIKKVEDLK